MRRGVVLHHERQIELVAAFGGHGDADQAATESRHEVDRFRGHLVGGKDQITFVLTVLVVDDDDLLASADALDGLFDGDEDVARDF